MPTAMGGLNTIGICKGDDRMLEIRKATAFDAEKILEYCQVIGGESDNLTFGAEGVSITIDREKEYLDSVFILIGSCILWL